MKMRVYTMYYIVRIFLNAHNNTSRAIKKYRSRNVTEFDTLVHFTP